MGPIKRLCAAVVAVFAYLGVSAELQAEARAPLVSVEDFFSNPSVKSPTICPDGSKIAFLCPYNGHLGVAVYTIGSKEGAAMVAAPSDGDATMVVWKGNDCLVYAGSDKGTSAYMVAAVDLKKRRINRLKEASGRGTHIVDTMPCDPDHIAMINRGYMAGDLRQNGTSTVRLLAKGISLVDVHSAVADVIYQPSESSNAIKWMLGSDRVVHLECRNDDDDTISWYYRGSEHEAFAQIAKFPINDSFWEPIVFAADNQTLYVKSFVQCDTGEIRTLDCKTLRMGPVLFHCAEGETWTAVLDAQQVPVGAVYSTDRFAVSWFDPKLRAVQSAVDAALPGMLNRIVDFDSARVHFLVESQSDRQPPIHYLLDVHFGTLVPIGRLQTKIRAEDMCPMRPISFISRDGLTLHGYLTLPKGSGAGPCPTILIPHDGPRQRDVWRFNPTVQFLTNRGYAVLQVNFRGSSGYGYSFAKAGLGEWGRKMQDDLTDGVHWAIEKGYADPKHIGIIGEGYGGYAALWGVESTPDLYSCAANYMGVSDLPAWAYGNGNLDRLAQASASLVFGGDSAALAKYSPASFINNIRVPTLHAYPPSHIDFDIDQWRSLKSQLDRESKSYVFVELPIGEHAFKTDQEKIRYYSALEKFLTKNL